jgi:elongation factor Tu
MGPLPCDVEAFVTYLPAEHGGKTIPVTTGYRPQFYYDGQDHDASHTYPDVERVLPGQSARVFLAFLHPETHIGKLHPGMPFLIREGQKVLGYGTVTRVVDLEASAERYRQVAS